MLHMLGLRRTWPGPCRVLLRLQSSSASGGGTYVSSHFRLDSSAIHAYLARRELAYRDTPTHTILRACPLCAKPHGDAATNLWKLYIRRADGAYFCHRCGGGGSWYDFKRKLGDAPEVEAPQGASAVRAAPAAAAAAPAAAAAATAAAASPPRAGAFTVDAEFALRASRELLDEGRFPAVLQYLTETRGLTLATLRRYCVGAVARDVPVTAAAAAAPPPASVPAVGGEADGLAALGSPARQRAAAAGGGSSSSSVTWERHDCIVFPWLAQRPGGSVGGGSGGEAASLVCSRVKLRSVRDKAVQMLLPRGGGWGMFGWHTVDGGSGSAGEGVMAAAALAAAAAAAPTDIGAAMAMGGGLSPPLESPPAGAAAAAASSVVVLTEGEFDAMAVHQATGLPAVSLPNGCRSLPVELLPLLERFGRIYLWMDDDLAGREGADRVSEKLGLGRCYIVRPRAELLLPRAPPAGGEAAAAAPAAAAPAAPLPAPKDANEALLRGLDFGPLLAAAAPRPHDQILRFGELRGAVMREVAASVGVFDSAYGGGRRGADGSWRAAAGVPYRTLPRLQRLLKGHRRGEVTIVTGPTGCGKTTLLSQLSLDLAARGVRTLWGSFEIKHTRLIAAMLTQLRSGAIPLDGDAAYRMHAPPDGAAVEEELEEEEAEAAAAAAALRSRAARGRPRGGGGGGGGGGATDLSDGDVIDVSSAAAPSAASPAGASPAATASGGGGGGGGSPPASTARQRRILRSYERAADVLDSLPLHFLRFYGSTDTERVLDALEYAHYVHDTEHVILDNLQFMMSGAADAGSSRRGGGMGGGGGGGGGGGSGSSGMYERFDAQERALDRFRAFATRHDVHLTLVIHPRKEPEDAPLSMSSVFGSAKATQEADSVFIIQRTPDGRKYIDVKKNRYDGAVGMVPLAFDADAKCFFESEAVVMPAGGGGGGGGGAAAAWPQPRAASGPPGRATRGFSTAATAGAAAAAGGAPSAAAASPAPSPSSASASSYSSSSSWWATQSRRARLRGQLEAEIDSELLSRVLPAAAARDGLLGSELQQDAATTVDMAESVR